MHSPPPVCASAGKGQKKPGAVSSAPGYIHLFRGSRSLSRESLLAAAEESAFKAGPGPDLVRAAGLKSEQIRRLVNTGSPESLFIRDPGISDGDLQPVAAAGERFRNAVSGAEKHLEFDGAVDPDELITCGAALCFQIQGAFPRTVRFVVQLRCLIDEAANIGQIPNLEKLVATIRSREISACLVLQARSQLKAIYKDNADTIIGNMDSQIFLGGSEPSTLKELAEALGKETIDTFNTSDTRGNSPSYGTNYQKLGKDLMTRDEISVMDGSKCILNDDPVKHRKRKNTAL